MPDLQSELSKVINIWSEAVNNPQAHTDTPQIAHYEQPSQAEQPEQSDGRPLLKDFVFNTIKKNPGITRARLLEVADAHGYKRGSAETVASKMVVQGFVSRENGGLHAIVQEVGVVKSSAYLKREALRLAKLEALKKARAAKAAKAAIRKKRAEVAAHKPVPERAAPELKVTMHEPHWDAEEMVNNLTLRQARSLYEALHRVFGH